MKIDAIEFIRLSNGYALKSFDCDDKDLNDFFKEDCLNYQKELLSVTYVLEKDGITIAFFSVANDNINIKTVHGNPNIFDKLFRKRMPEGKRIPNYPAMKICRLGVHKDYQKKKIGSEIINYLKALFVTNNRTGCKYITVDAYKESLAFYEKNGFNFFTEKDVNKDTRAMYFDLEPVAKALA